MMTAAIAFVAMRRLSIDAYVLDTLLPDLVGHDRKPAAFLVYLYLLGASERSNRASLAISLQEIAVRTGLAKSTVQGAIRHLKRRGLIDAKTVATTSQPIRRIMKPWTK
jgi:DNA-binding MarR family transcriptional regulator